MHQQVRHGHKAGRETAQTANAGYAERHRLEDGTDTEKRIWEKEVDEYMKRRSVLNLNIRTLYSLVWGQCTDAFRARIEARSDYDGMSRNAQELNLLGAIKDVVYNFQDQKYIPHSIHDAKRRFYGLIQGKHMSTQAYYESFQNHLDVIEHINGRCIPQCIATSEHPKKRHIHGYSLQCRRCKH